MAAGSAKVIPLFAPAMTTEKARREVEARGYHVAYRGGGQDWCPGCAGRQWHVGRIYAECARCGTAIPLNLATAESNANR